jgi:hypothetical protein
MRVRHTISAALACVLLIQSVGLAQSGTGPMGRAAEQAVHRIPIASVQVGMELRFDLVDGRRIEGRLVEESDDEFVVGAGSRRLAFPVAAVIAVGPLNRQRQQQLQDGRGQISAAIILGVLLLAVVKRPH